MARSLLTRKKSLRLAKVARKIATLNSLTVERSALWAWMGLLAFGILSFGAVEPWSISMFQICSAIVFIWWLLSAMHRGHIEVHLPLIFAPAALFGALIVLQITAGTSAYRLASENSLALALAYGTCMFVGAQVLCSEYSFKTFGLAVSAFGLCVAALAMAQALTAPGEIYWTVYPAFGDGVFGPYVNHSHYAGLMEMLLPFPVLLAFGRTIPRNSRNVAIAASVIMGASVFMSGSRGGIVAITAEMLITYGFVARHAEGDRSSSRRRWLSFLGLVGVIAFICFLGGKEMIARISSLKDPYGASVGATRIAIAKDCVTMFLRRPILGWGAGVFSDVYPTFRSFSTNLVVNAAHNDYLQLMVEYGLAGVAIVLGMLVLTFRRIAILCRNWRDSWPHTVSSAALLGTIGILFHSFTDFNLQIPANAAVFLVMCTVACLEPPEFSVPSRESSISQDLSSEE